jgi:hypothetical protein
MKRDNDFFYFLSFITFYTLMLLLYTHYNSAHEAALSAQYATPVIDEYTYINFVFEVVLAFPFGILDWFNGRPLNIVFFFFGALFYSFLFYQVYYKNIRKPLWVMVVLNILAALFLLAFYTENPISID